MSVMNKISAAIIECLEQGHLPEQIAEALEVPVEWVQTIESMLVDAVDAGGYDDIGEREYIDHLYYS